MREITKNSGETEPFSAAKLRRGVESAYLGEIKNLNGAAAILAPDLETEIDNLVRAVEEDCETNAGWDAESLHTSVEGWLYHLGRPQIAKRYIFYREEKRRRQVAAESQSRIHITRRDGTRVRFSPKPLIRAIESACRDLTGVSPQALFAEAERNLYDGVRTEEIQGALINAGRDFIEEHPNYRFVAARLLLQQLTEEVAETLGIAIDACQLPLDYTPVFKKSLESMVGLELLDPALLDFNLEELAKKIVPDRDFIIAYMGLVNLGDRYYARTPKTRKLLELPQIYWMRVAMGLALKEKDRNERAKEFYEVLSQFSAMCSTPTLFNSGTLHPQLSSCCLGTIQDDLDGIFHSLRGDGQLSKWAGGLGNDWTNVRASGSLIRGTNGPSLGIVPFLRIQNAVAAAVNQGSKRKGAVCAYLESWHFDVVDFVSLRKNTGDERRRCHDIDTANWIPDLLMERVAEEGCWTLFSPSNCPDLHDCYGAEFRGKYFAYERAFEAGPLRRVSSDLDGGEELLTEPEHPLYPARRVSAKALWRHMIIMLYTSGHPWETFKDAANLRSPMRELGTIHCSNLCTEILLNTSYSRLNARGEIAETGERAVCNLASINLVNHVFDGALNIPRLRDTIRTVMRMLDNVVDLNFYPIPEAENANRQHRPVGMGVMGWHDMLGMMGIPYDSEEAAIAASEIMENIAFLAYEASHDLARERGAFSQFAKSDWARGILPHHTMERLAGARQPEHAAYLPVARETMPEAWSSLARKIREKGGIRNSLCLAIAPTATIGQIVGVSNSIDPHRQIIYARQNLSGDFTVMHWQAVEKLISLGLWTPEIRSAIKSNDGSMNGIEEIPAEVSRLYRCAYEFHPRWLIESAAARQIWMDMGQSLNLYMDKPAGSEISDVYFLAWLRGLKTTYYLRGRGASGREKVSVDEPVEKQKEKACRIKDPACEACQ